MSSVYEEMDLSEAWTLVCLNMDEVRRVRTMGAFGCLPFLRLRREIKGMGIPLDGCYAGYVENAPLFQDLAQGMWLSPDWVERFKG